MLLLPDFLRDTAQRRSDHVAVCCADRALSFDELERASDSLAAQLQAAGLQRGDRVAILMDNVCELPLAVFGTSKAGGVFVPINPGTKLPKLVHLLRDSGARVLLTQPHLADLVARAAPEAPALQTVLWTAAPAPGAPAGASFAPPGTGAAPRDPGLIDEDLAAIIYTSGSTGAPKGVMLTHRNITNTAWSISTYLQNTPDDIVICVLPLSFDYGLYQVLTGARVGFTVVLERSFAFPYQVLARMAELGVTGLPGVPTVFATLLQMADFTVTRLPALRYVTNTAAALPPAHIRQLQVRFPKARIYSMYGLTECTRVSYLDPTRLADKTDSVGKAMPNCEAYVVDEQGVRTQPGVVGELVIRGANVMRGYWGKPAETDACLRAGQLVGEKVLYTGDLFYTDEEGFLYFVGRHDDVFKCRGEKVSPREVEATLYELDGVAEAAVVGVADAIDGFAVKAFIVPRAGALLGERDIRRHCRARLEPHLVPSHICLCTQLPKTDSGKIRKRDLRELVPPREAAAT